MSSSLKIVVSGAAGQIAYSLLPLSTVRCVYMHLCVDVELGTDVVLAVCVSVC